MSDGKPQGADGRDAGGGAENGSGPESVRRHEAHLVGQIYHLIEANHRLEEQLHRLGKVTEIADLFREKKITRDTFELKPPKLLVPVQAETAWNRIDKMLARLDEGIGETEGGLGAVGADLSKAAADGASGKGPAPATRRAASSDGDAGGAEGAESGDGGGEGGDEGDDGEPDAAAEAEARAADLARLAETLAAVTAGVAELRASLVDLRDGLGVVRESAWSVDPDWQAEVRGRLVAAEQAVAFLNEQSRELDMLRREKDAIMDGASRLEQNIEDLWKALNEKTTHIQRIEAELSRIWVSVPYRIYRTLTRPFRGKKKS